MGNLIRIVSAVVNQSTLVLYEATGVSHRIPQGDPRVKRILDQAIPDIERQKFSDVDLSEELGYTSFEKNSTGSVKSNPRALLMTFQRVMSAQSTRVTATPVLPARPVRPMRCT